jgi:hypothetical protein
LSPYADLARLMGRKTICERIKRDEGALADFHERRHAEHNERWLAVSREIEQIEAELDDLHRRERGAA